MLDLLFAYRTADGEVGSLELAGIAAMYGPLYTSVDGQVPGGLLDQARVPREAVLAALAGTQS